ncbi:MAG: LPS assembly protein LptD [Pseudomonadota bacterium]
MKRFFLPLRLQSVIAAAVWWLSLCPLLAATPAWGAEAVRQGPIRLEADSVQFNPETAIYSATGNVTIAPGKGLWLRADSLTYGRDTGVVEATGGIHAIMDGNEIWADRATLNLDASAAFIERARIFIPQANYFITAGTLEKIGPDCFFRAKDAKITTCQGDTPAWSLTAGTINLRVEGYATIYGSAFRVKDVPVLYSPFFVLPAKLKRQTGFLVPLPGASSRDGFTLDAPFFWAMTDNMDATLHTSLKTSRGVMEGAEYRYVFSPGSLGTIQASYLRDGKTDENFREVDHTLRANKDRWWLRGMADQALPRDFFLRASLDAVSDENYLREFVRGYQGFSASNEYFSRVFGRSLQERTDPVRESSLLVFQGQGVQYVSGEVHYYQDLLPGRDNLALQRLPTLRYNLTEHALLGGPLYGQVSARYDDFYRAASPTVAPRGQRLDLEPTLRLPLHCGRYLTAIPNVSLRETAYIIEGRQDGRNLDGLTSREDYSVGGSLSTQLSRVFNAPIAGLSAVKHIVRPELTYIYRPRLDQSGLLQFDPLDFLAPRNLLTLSVTNDLIGKITTGGDNSYPHLARLRLAQGYDFDHRDTGLTTDAPLAPFLAETQITCGNLYFDGEAEWDWDQAVLTRYGVLGSWTHPAGHSVSLDYQYLRGVAEEIDLAGTLRVRYLDFYTSQRNSLRAGRLIESLFGVRYHAQCWGVDFSYRQDPFDHEVLLRFSLGGIGEVGPFGFTTPGGQAAGP